jgi:hypothetical protein
MNELGGYAFADLRVGMCATFAKTVTEADIVLMAHAARAMDPRRSPQRIGNAHLADQPSYFDRHRRSAGTRS